MSRWKHRRLGGFSASWLATRLGTEDGPAVANHFDVRIQGWRYLRFRYQSHPVTLGDRSRSLNVSCGRAA